MFGSVLMLQQLLVKVIFTITLGGLLHLLLEVPIPTLRRKVLLYSRDSVYVIVRLITYTTLCHQKVVALLSYFQDVHSTSGDSSSTIEFYDQSNISENITPTRRVKTKNNEIQSITIYTSKQSNNV